MAGSGRQWQAVVSSDNFPAAVAAVAALVVAFVTIAMLAIAAVVLSAVEVAALAVAAVIRAGLGVC